MIRSHASLALLVRLTLQDFIRIPIIQLLLQAGPGLDGVSVAVKVRECECKI